MILIDSDALIDILDRDPSWFHWSLASLERVAVAGPVTINPIVVAEAAPRFGNLQRVMSAMEEMGIGPEPLDADAAFNAGAAFQRYRRSRPAEAPKAMLAHFLIAGHAQAIGAAVLSRDPRFCRRYFPELTLITPETHP